MSTDKLTNTTGLSHELLALDAKNKELNAELLKVKSELLRARAKNDTKDIISADEPIHNWFELSYAQYLTIPRSVLQSMPAEWQSRFVQCLNELNEMIDWKPKEGLYRVTLCEVEEVWDDDLQCHMEQWGHEFHDPLQDYDRGRRKLPLKG